MSDNQVIPASAVEAAAIVASRHKMYLVREEIVAILEAAAPHMSPRG